MRKEKMAPKRRKKIPKSRNKALHSPHREKGPYKGGNPSWIFLQWGARVYSPSPPLLLAHMIKSDYKMRNNFENY